MNLSNKPPIRQTDKLCLVALAGVLIATTLIYEMTDGRVMREAAAKEDRPATITVTAPTIDFTPLVEAVEARREELFWGDVPLDKECREALLEACGDNGVPMCLALGVIYAESHFDPDTDNGLSYGLMGLNRNYYPSGLTPAENLRAGVEHLAGQIEQYDGDIQAALRAYNLGHDDGDRHYARAVLDASEKWGCG